MFIIIFHSHTWVLYRSQNIDVETSVSRIIDAIQSLPRGGETVVGEFEQGATAAAGAAAAAEAAAAEKTCRG